MERDQNRSFAASAPVLLLAHSPHGLEEVHRLMFSTLLGATSSDVAVFVAAAIATSIAVVVWSAPLRLFASDVEMAATKKWKQNINKWVFVFLAPV